YVGAQHHHRPRPVTQHADDTGAADARRHLASGRGDGGGHPRRGVVLLQRELRIAVQLAVQPGQPTRYIGIEINARHAYRYWPRLLSVSIARDALDDLPVTNVRM